EQTFWTVWLPHDRKLTKAEGNMEEVIEVLREVEKTRSAVEELKTLNAIVSDKTLSQETRAKAQSNWSEVYGRCLNQLTVNSGVLQSGRSAGKMQEDIRGKEQEKLISA